MSRGPIQNKSAKTFLAIIVLVGVRFRDLLVETQLSRAHGAALESLHSVHLSLYLSAY